MSNINFNQRAWQTWALGLLLAISSQASAQQPRIPPKYAASPLEIAQLPQYCWAQYVDGAYFGHPVYSIPASCGPYTNHFCPALVSLIQASEASRNMNQRREAARHAGQEVRYTLRYIDASCAIYPDVKAAEMRADFLRRLLQ